MRKGVLLSHIRAVELGDGYVGGWAGLLLADLGVEIIKVESMNRMDMTRGPASLPRLSGDAIFPMYPNGEPGGRPWNRNAQYNACNVGKYGVTLDLAKPKGLDTFMRLVKVSDVFFSNMAVGVAEKLGITYDTLAEANPEIVYLSSVGYGRTGPYADRVAMGNTIDGAAGLLGLRDYGDGDSTAVSPDVHCDTIAALTNALALVIALYYRRKTGKGVYIDASMVEPSMSHIGEAIMDYAMNQRVQRSLGNRDMSMSPQGCYRCKGEDEWVTLSVASDTEWQHFAEAAGHPQWADDERFANALGRLRNQDALDELIGAWTAEYTKYEVMNLLQEAGIAAGAVLNNAEVYSDAHLRERGFFDAIDEPEAGIHTCPGRPWKLGVTETPKRKHAPLLGEHNDRVLGEIAGLTPDEILELEQEGIIGTTPVEV